MRIRPLRTLRPPRPFSATFSRPSPPKRFLAGDLVELLDAYLSKQEVADVYRAYLFGAEAHEGQTRRSGEPYIYHPIEVARILAEMRLDSRSIIAALLHDVIEDTPTAKEHLAQTFGEDVAELVDGVSKISQIEFKTKEERQAENFRKMLLAMAQDIRVILIKLADRLHNMRTLSHMPADKQRSIAKETLDIYAPIANRLGVYQWYRELEDLGWASLYPMRKQALEKATKNRQGNRKALVRKIQEAIEKQFVREEIVARVTGREKHLYSLYQKMRKKRRGFEEVYDALGYRLIVDTVDSCYRVLGVMHNLYKPIPGRFKDYIAIPKANGYQSLHTVVFGPYGQSIEIQIRTEDMHRVAEAGVAAHWLFKSGDKQGSGGKAAQQAARQWLLELLKIQQKAGNPHEFLEHLKVDLFPDEVYVFTPKGEIKKLPRGATALDFAYSVHTDLGNRCTGIKINHQPAALRSVLHNGDHVEILTSHRAIPNPSWLNFAATGKARATIRSYLKAQQWKQSVRLGKRLLKKSLRAVGIKRLTAARKQGLLDTMKFKQWDELLADIGLGNRVAVMVAHQLVAPGADVDSSTEKPQPLVITGTEGMLISFGRCCRPIPNDPIFGYLTAGKGIVIHADDCPNLIELKKTPEKLIEVGWEEGLEGAYTVNIKVEVTNKRGVLAKLATVIAEAKSNIENVSVLDRDDATNSINFTVEVKNRIHLASIIRDLRAQETVIRVVRTKG
ncbi:MAG TPA: bifunctional (p)ppGpp synthetase/guanosine-3',5'-bis(diphosphate) 3'-pyrophosphohydrolase [Acidiferrobacteraceae bacterium]|nr:bifunctional (p)ppGpp synthetase/guanosine-3',5'-bis(diphosphate) 3'-pyrophosphohydrolase [Acidiferrobacteraceae bacterium]